MKKENFSKLIELANKAKDVRLYDVANIIFAILLQAAFRVTQLDATENGPPELWLEWETQDDDGQVPQEVYYDLVVVNHWDEHVKSVCIPVPLLAMFSAIAALKRAKVVAREQHGREIREASEKEIADLWRELGQLVTAAEVKCAVDEHLDAHDDHGQPFAPRLSSLIEERLADVVPAEPGVPAHASLAEMQQTVHGLLNQIADLKN